MHQRCCSFMVSQPADMPPRDAFPYTFAKLAEVIGHFTEAVNLKRLAIYIFDYGAPVGLRIALKHPERIAAIISQNGNAYEEGLSDGWNPIRLIGESLPRPTGTRCEASCRLKQPSGNTPTV
jgi:pimeloyl-ACP methyl ester carboxylesterase